MKYKTFLLLLLFVFSTIGGTNGGRFSSGRSSSGRGSSTHRTSYGGSSSGHKIGSYGTSSTNYGSVSRSKPTSSGHTPSISQRPIGFGTSGGRSSVPHSTGTSLGQNKNVNTHFLNAEGGGASRPVQTKPLQTSSTIGQSHLPNTGSKPGVITESKQASASLQPSAPNEHVIRPTTNTFQNQGQANPPWSNPYLGTNHGATSSQAHSPWNNPSLNINQPSKPGQTQPSWSNPHSTVNQPIHPGSQPPPYGFNVHPQTHPSTTGFHPNQPHVGGRPMYPHTASPSSPWSPPFSSPPIHQPGAMPFGNPYSLHPPGNTYGSSGPSYYPQQSHVLAQPAMQPFVPGQTIVMMPGHQDSGRGFGQMIKEALVFSTVNAGVNRLLNPHTHHYVESRPDSGPSTTTHITYNNQYFNTPPGMNSTTNPTSMPQGSVSTDGHLNGAYTPNAAGSGPSLANGNMYPTSIPNSGVSGPSGTVSGGGGTTTGIGMAGNVAAPTSQSSALSNQGNITANPNATQSTFFNGISEDQLFKITEELFAKAPDVSKYIKLNLQSRSTSFNGTDEAREPLFTVEPELLNYPSISVTRSLYDSYKHNSREKLNRTLEIREHENLLIDTFLNTNVIASAMQWLADRGFIDPDDFERKDVLRRIWFTIFSGSSCGFERVFASESYDTAIIGVQDWIYFEYLESLKRVDYMSYVDKLNLGNTASLLKLNFQMDGIVRPNATIFVGTMPELEMSLYTICFYTRPNNVCPVSLGGTKFNIYTHAFTYFGNDVIDLGLPLF